MDVDFLEQDLKRWGKWVVKQMDRSMGWPKESPIVKFGTVTGGRACTEYDTTGDSIHMEWLNGEINRLDRADYLLIRLFYVDHACNLRRVARTMICSHQTVKNRLNKVKNKLIDVYRTNSPVYDGSR